MTKQQSCDRQKLAKLKIYLGIIFVILKLIDVVVAVYSLQLGLK